MRWKMPDAKDYLQSKDYIDTAVIPLINIKMGSQIKIAAERGEFTQPSCGRIGKAVKRTGIFIACLYIC